MPLFAPKTRTAALLSCLLLAACAGASPEDAHMADALCAQGKDLLAAGKNSEAADMYASAITRDRHNARAWNGLGVAEELSGKPNEAEDAYQSALDLSPHDMSAANNMAHLYMTRGDYKKAAELLAPFAQDPAAPDALRQNYAAAQAALATQQAVASSYADVGSFPTEGLAQAHLNEAGKLLGREAKSLTFTIDPEVKVSGGTPVFTAKITGASPQDVCDALIAKAIPCVPHGK